MKALIVAVVVTLIGVSVGNADPVAACTNLVGTYAELETPDSPILTVTLTNGQFSVIVIGDLKTIVDVTPTEKGLVFVENPKTRHVVRLSSSTNLNMYVFELLGRHSEGSPLPEGPGLKLDIVRIQLAQTEITNAIHQAQLYAEIKKKGRMIWLSIVSANMKREVLEMPYVWPTTGYATSTDYFKYLMGWTMNINRPTAYTPGSAALCEDLKTLVLAGLNIPPASDPGAFGSTNNAWCVVATDEKEQQVPPDSPFLFTRNIEVTVQDGNVRLWLTDEMPFRTKACVVVTRGGGVRSLMQKELDKYAQTLNPVLLRHVLRP
jgi:hypothetical protein